MTEGPRRRRPPPPAFESDRVSVGDNGAKGTLGVGGAAVGGKKQMVGSPKGYQKADFVHEGGVVDQLQRSVREGGHIIGPSGGWGCRRWDCGEGGHRKGNGQFLDQQVPLIYDTLGEILIFGKRYYFSAPQRSLIFHMVGSLEGYR
jgi:hypothetical protein